MTKTFTEKDYNELYDFLADFMEPRFEEGNLNKLTSPSDTFQLHTNEIEKSVTITLFGKHLTIWADGTTVFEE